jgi:hypothetical protein
MTTGYILAFIVIVVGKICCTPVSREVGKMENQLESFLISLSEKKNSIPSKIKELS